MSWRGEWAYKYESSLSEASTRIFDFKQSEQWWHWWGYGRRHWRRYGRNSIKLEDGSWALKLGIWDIHYQEALWFIRSEVDIFGIVEVNMDFTLEDPKNLKERHHTLFLRCATACISVSANLSLLMSLMLRLFLVLSHCYQKYWSKCFVSDSRSITKSWRLEVMTTRSCIASSEINLRFQRQFPSLYLWYSTETAQT